MINRIPQLKLRLKRAFSLVELLVGASILIIMVLFMTQFFAGASKVWRDAENRYAATRDARAALQRISRELGNITKLRDDDTFLIRQNFYKDTGPGLNNQEIYFSFTNRMGRSGDGDVVAAGYYTQFSAGTYVLRRTFVNSNRLFERLTTIPGPKKIIGSTASILGIPTGVRSGPPDVDSLFVPCLWDLKFNIAIQKPDGSIEMKNNNNVEFKGTEAMPLYIDVSFKTIGGSDIQRIITRNIPEADWFDTASPNYIYTLAPVMREFSTRVFLGHRFPPQPTPTPAPTPTP